VLEEQREGQKTPTLYRPALKHMQISRTTPRRSQALDKLRGIGGTSSRGLPSGWLMGNADAKTRRNPGRWRIQTHKIVCWACMYWARSLAKACIFRGDLSCTGYSSRKSRSPKVSTLGL